MAFALVLAVAMALTSAATAEPLPPTDLRINYMSEPLGFDSTLAHFTWRLSQDRSTEQLAARIIVVELDATLAFDSGRVTTDQPELANTPPMPPMALRSDAVYTWWVEVWTAASPNAPVRSANATFTTGVIAPGEWETAGARWIRGGVGSMQMRKEFTVPSSLGPVSRVTLFIAACHYYTLFLDGAPVGRQRLDGPWTEFYTNRRWAIDRTRPRRLYSSAASSRHTYLPQIAVRR